MKFLAQKHCRKTSATGARPWSLFSAPIASEPTCRTCRPKNTRLLSIEFRLHCVGKAWAVLIQRLAIGIPIKFFSPVTLVDWGDRSVALQAGAGAVTARAVIVTASTAVLASGKIKFKPNLPAPYWKAVETLKLGSYDHVAIEFNGNPLGLDPNEVVFEKAIDSKTAALFANLHGTRLSILLVGGKMGAQLAEQGDSAMKAFALDWISRVFGSNINKAVLRTHTHVLEQATLGARCIFLSTSGCARGSADTVPAVK